VAAYTDVYKCSLFPRTIRDWNSLDAPYGPSLFHNLQLTFPTANVMHPSGNGLSPLLGMYHGMYRSTKQFCIVR